MLKSTWLYLKIILGLCLALSLIQVINHSGDYFLTRLGVFPRQNATLGYIFSAPFIHGSYSHLLNNLVGLSIFSALCLLRSLRFYLFSSAFIIIVSGLLVWLFARPAWHIGASGWIFGLWAVTIAMGYFDRQLKNIALALLVIFLYGGMVYGVLPGDKGVSFEFHLAGAIAGILYAGIYSRFNKKNTG